MNAVAGRGRRLSLVEELNQTIDLEYSFNGEYDANIATNESLRRPRGFSSTVINELYKEPRDEESNLDAGSVETNAGFYRNQNNEKQRHSTEVAELRNQLDENISQLSSKLFRMENQLALIIRLMQSQKSKPELKPRHAHSFPTPATSSGALSLHDVRSDHHASSANSVAASDGEKAESPRWLSSSPSKSNHSHSDPNYGKTSSKRDLNNETASPVVNVARHGRRKISDT